MLCQVPIDLSRDSDVVLQVGKKVEEKITVSKLLEPLSTFKNLERERDYLFVKTQVQ